MEVKSTVDKERKIQVILIIAIVLISISAIIWLIFPSGTTTEHGPTEPVPTATYTGISPENASNLINSSDNIIIVDVRSCKCNYDKGHLPDATWNIDPLSFFNETRDLLIYDNNLESCIDFCNALVNNTYVAIYYLEGGINAWIRAGYPTVN